MRFLSWTSHRQLEIIFYFIFLNNHQSGTKSNWGTQNTINHFPQLLPSMLKCKTSKSLYKNTALFDVSLSFCQYSVANSRSRKSGSSPQINCSNIQTLPSFAELNSFAPPKINVLPSSQLRTCWVIFGRFWISSFFRILTLKTDSHPPSSQYS